MPRRDYIPYQDDQFLTWHDAFKAAATPIAATVSLSATDLAAIAADNAAIHAKVAAAMTATGTAQSATADKVATRKTVEANTRNLANRVKLHKNYTATIGEQLGIEGAVDATDLSTANPQLKVKSQPNAVAELTFVKSKADGVNIYSQREGDTDWKFLARDTFSPYVDNRPLLVAGKPEVRRYKARLLVNDQEIGEPAEITVTVRP